MSLSIAPLPRTASGPLDLSQLWRSVLATRTADSSWSADLERRLLAATLSALAEWLGEQSELLADEPITYPADDLAKARVAKLVAATCARPRRPGCLTRREAQIAGLIARGLSNRQIAENLVIATSTTERHVANILTKLGMRSRSQVAAWAVENGL